MSDERGVQHGGVAFRVADRLFFLPASIAVKVMPAPDVARIPGGPRELCGIALVDGGIIPVVDATSPPDGGHVGRVVRPSEPMLVCVVLGERVGFVGIDVVATGRFAAGEHDGEVVVGDETASTFDLEAAIAMVSERRWAV
ncbi:MAG TPA: chemotaxis protein CheW [Labilithrix sp.]|jgi:chemotaxis signal transduction protein|nr:chemotaxis protein CheW [Labilithrix sp.]